MLRTVTAVVLAISVLGAWSQAPGAQDRCTKTEVARVVRVIDGDTFEAEVVLVWLQTTMVVRERFRVLGVDAWEIGDGERGKAAKEFTERWLAGAAGRLFVQACNRDNFGRVLAVVFHAGTGERLDEALIAAGHGVRR